MKSFWLLVAALTTGTPVLAGVKEVWWNITYVQNANPDGLAERRVIGVNNTWPYVFLFCSKSWPSALVTVTEVPWRLVVS